MRGYCWGDAGEVVTRRWQHVDTDAEGVGSKGKVLVGQEVAVRCAHGASYPLADIDVGVDGRRFTMWASVSDKLLVPLLFG